MKNIYYNNNNITINFVFIFIGIISILIIIKIIIFFTDNICISEEINDNYLSHDNHELSNTTETITDIEIGNTIKSTDDINIISMNEENEKNEDNDLPSYSEVFSNK